MTTTTKAILLGLLACLLWSGNFVIARGASTLIEPITLSFMRWLTALIFILPFTLRKIISQLPLIHANIKYLIFMGIISVGTFNTLVYLSAHYTTTHHISLICATSPIWTVLIAGFLRVEKLTKSSVLGAAIAFFGALIIISSGNLRGILHQTWNQGDIILLIAAFIWAVYSVLLTRKPAALSTSSFLTIIIFIGLLFLFPFYLWQATQGTPTPLDAQSLGIYLYVGIAASLISWFSWNNAVAAIGSVKTGLISYSMPVFSAILAIIFLDEPLQIYHVCGFLSVVIGIAVSNFSKLQT